MQRRLDVVQRIVFFPQLGWDLDMLVLPSFQRQLQRLQEQRILEKHRLTPLQFFAKMRTQGISPSPLFSAIGFTLLMVMIDVLHCMDLGCTQDILGNIMWGGQCQ